MPDAKTGAKSCKLKDGSSDILFPPSPGGNIPTCVSSCQNSGHFAVGIAGLLQKVTLLPPPRHNAPPYIDELHTSIQLNKTHYSTPGTGSTMTLPTMLRMPTEAGKGKKALGDA